MPFFCRTDHMAFSLWIGSTLQTVMSALYLLPPSGIKPNHSHDWADTAAQPAHYFGGGDTVARMALQVDYDLQSLSKPEEIALRVHRRS